MSQGHAPSTALYRRLNAGLVAYHGGDPFEAHEIWEELWREEVGLTKRVLQALIQVAAAVYKHQQGVEVGTSKLLAKALSLIEESIGSARAWLGLDLVALAEDVRRALATSDARLQGDALPFAAPALPDRLGADGILYLHGFASGPDSFKAQHVTRLAAQLDLSIVRPDLNGDDFEHLTITRALERARRCLRDRTLVVGSSFGGFLAALLASRDERVRGLVLLAPAFGIADRLCEHYGPEAVARWQADGRLFVPHHAAGGETRAIRYEFVEDAHRYPTFPPVQVPVHIIHGSGDTIIPSQVSEVYAKEGRVTLQIVDDDHPLTRSTGIVLDAVRGAADSLGLHPDPEPSAAPAGFSNRAEAS